MCWVWVCSVSRSLLSTLTKRSRHRKAGLKFRTLWFHCNAHLSESQYIHFSGSPPFKLPWNYFIIHCFLKIYIYISLSFLRSLVCHVLCMPSLVWALQSYKLGISVPILQVWELKLNKVKTTYPRTQWAKNKANSQHQVHYTQLPFFLGLSLWQKGEGNFLNYETLFP